MSTPNRSDLRGRLLCRWLIAGLALAAVNAAVAQSVDKAPGDQPAETGQGIDGLREKIRAVIQAAVDEHSKGGVILRIPRLYAQAQGSTDSELARQPVPKEFKPWKLDYEHLPSMSIHYSKSLEAYVDTFSWTTESAEQRSERNALIVKLVAEELKSPLAAQRAAACEMLAYLPLEMISFNLFPELLRLIRDDAVAFSGTKLVAEIPPRDAREYDL